ncbi:MAG: hypothetical protein JWP14_3025 [Frankiales bacterium]|nr:hypothetical protein [Frankiales bacterium]
MGEIGSAEEAALTRLRELTCLLQWLRTQETALAAERDETIMKLVAEGLSYEQVRLASGVSRGRVGQIVQQSRP